MSAMRDFWTNVVPEVVKANGAKSDHSGGAGVREPVALAAIPGDAPAGPYLNESGRVGLLYDQSYSESLGRRNR